MQFYEKLDFLMDLTKTSNSVLSRHMSFDASYISRLRSGKRMPPRSEDINSLPLSAIILNYYVSGTNSSAL